MSEWIYRDLSRPFQQWIGFMKAKISLTEINLTLLPSMVTHIVRECLEGVTKPNADVIERLRTYERTARDVDLGGQAIQIIASGRRLLGDHRDLSPS